MKHFVFELTMPGRNSWNGQWSGDDDYYAVVRSYPDNSESMKNIQRETYQDYDFGDGWRASVSIKEIVASEKKSIKKKNNGFQGYDWMIDSIEKIGYIA